MRRAELGLLLLAGCATDPAGPASTTHVEVFELPGRTAPRLDVLFVVDDSTAMAPFADVLAALPETALRELDGTDTAQPDVRIFATTTVDDGLLRHPATTPTEQPYLAFGYDDHFARVANYEGTFGDALHELLDVGTTRTGVEAPLGSMRRVLREIPGIFRRDALLAIVTVAGADDASGADIGAAVAEVMDLRTDPRDVFVSGVYSMPAPQLDAFHASFPNRNATVDIASPDAGETLQLSHHVLTDLVGPPCVQVPADREPECSIEAAYADGSSEVVPPCTPSFDGRCFDLRDDPLNCLEPGSKRLYLHGFTNRYYPPLRGQCVI